MILLPKIRLGAAAFHQEPEECMQSISSLGIRHVNIFLSLLNADNTGAFRENAEKHKIRIEAVCTGTIHAGCAELAAAAGAQALCIMSEDSEVLNAIFDSAKSAGLKYLIWEPVNYNIEACRRILADINKASAIPLKLAIGLGGNDIHERCRIVGKDAMIMIRSKDDLQMLGKAIDSLRTGGSRENIIILDMPSADIDSLKASVDYCRNFVRE